MIIWDKTLNPVIFATFGPPWPWLDLDWGHTAYRRVALIDLYLNTKCRSNQSNFLVDGRTDTETGFTRSTRRNQSENARHKEKQISLCQPVRKKTIICATDSCIRGKWCRHNIRRRQATTCCQRTSRCSLHGWLILHRTHSTCSLSHYEVTASYTFKQTSLMTWQHSAVHM